MQQGGSTRDTPSDWALSRGVSGLVGALTGVTSEPPAAVRCDDSPAGGAGQLERRRLGASASQPLPRSGIDRRRGGGDLELLEEDLDASRCGYQRHEHF